MFADKQAAASSGRAPTIYNRDIFCHEYFSRCSIENSGRNSTSSDRRTSNITTKHYTRKLPNVNTTTTATTWSFSPSIFDKYCSECCSAGTRSAVSTIDVPKSATIVRYFI